MPKSRQILRSGNVDCNTAFVPSGIDCDPCFDSSAGDVAIGRIVGEDFMALVNRDCTVVIISAYSRNYGGYLGKIYDLMGVLGNYNYEIIEIPGIELINNSLQFNRFEICNGKNSLQ